MKKLLHEQLREWAESPYPISRAIGELVSEHSGHNEENSLLNKLADEIERYYIPRPRFENGEPIAKGCEVEGGSVDGWCIWDDGGWQVNDADGNIIQTFEDYGGFIKRPTLKVLDADGVEIKVGDTVYYFCPDTFTVGEEPLKVCKIDASRVCPMVYTEQTGETGYGAGLLTHEKPVLDADGVRIRVGDTVFTKYGEGHVVASVHVAGDKPAPYHSLASKPFVRYGDYGSLWNYADDVSHQEPDSLEKLRDDMNYRRIEGTYPGTAHEYLCKCADRLTALIERGA